MCPCSTGKVGISIKWLWRRLANELDWSLGLLELSRTSHSAYLHPSIIVYCESLRVTWTTGAGPGSSSKDQPRVGVENGLNFLTMQLCSLCTSYREDKTNNFQPIFLIISPVVLLESPRIRRGRHFWKCLGLDFWFSETSSEVFPQETSPFTKLWPCQAMVLPTVGKFCHLN